MFIALEGIDACGKSTQAELLSKKLDAKTFKFPDKNTPMGSLIYSHLRGEWRADSDSTLDSAFGGHEPEYVNAMVFQALQLSNRMEHASSIECWVRQGKNVVCDRHWASGTVYGHADGIATHYLIGIHETLARPELNVLVDIPLFVSKERRPDRRDRYEEKDCFLERVINNYRDFWAEMQIAYGHPHWVVVDGTKPVEAVHEDIMSAVAHLAELAS